MRARAQAIAERDRHVVARTDLRMSSSARRAGFSVMCATIQRGECRRHGRRCRSSGLAERSCSDDAGRDRHVVTPAAWWRVSTSTSPLRSSIELTLSSA